MLIFTLSFLWFCFLWKLLLIQKICLMLNHNIFHFITFASLYKFYIISFLRFSLQYFCIFHCCNTFASLDKFYIILKFYSAKFMTLSSTFSPFFKASSCIRYKKMKGLIITKNIIPSNARNKICCCSKNANNLSSGKNR